MGRYLGLWSIWEPVTVAGSWPKLRFLVKRTPSSDAGSYGSMLWQPTTGLVRVLTFHDVPALPWTPPCPATLLWWWGCSSSADWTLRRIFGRGATVNCRVLKCIPRNWNSWLGVRSDFSKLITHPSIGCSAMVISECIWVCSGESAQISQLSK